MLHSVKQLHGYKLGALDGEIGRVKGFYFDDKDWVVRYLVVDTGSWIPGRKVLISPYALGGIYPGGNILEVALTREKIEKSPSIETQLPVAREHERDYYRYYNWPVYWGGSDLWGMNPAPFAPPSYQSPEEEGQQARAEESEKPDSHLRSTQEVTGYDVQAVDGEVGHVEDFLIDDENWTIHSLVVATGHWWSGKNVLLPPREIEKVSWDESKVFTSLTRLKLQQEPQYEPAVAASGDHDPRLFRH